MNMANSTDKQRLLNREWILILLVSVTFFIVYLKYIFDGNMYVFRDMGSDCRDQFFPMYNDIVLRLRKENFSLWNADWGLGMDVLTRQEWIMDPAALIIILAGWVLGTGVIAPLLVVTQYIKVLLCGVLMLKLLEKYGIKSEVSLLLGSYVYAFNPFLMLWGQHYYFGAACIYIVILMILIEDWLAERNVRSISNTATSVRSNILLYYALTVGLFCIYSVYLCYMAMVFMAFYILLRYLFSSYCGIKCLLADAAKVIAYTFLGLFIATGMIVVFYDINVNVSFRISDMPLLQRLLTVPKRYPLTYYKQIISRMVSSNILESEELGGYYYELPQLAVAAVGGIPLLAQGYLNICKSLRHSGIRQKIVFGLSSLLVFVLVFLPVGSMIVNGFQYPFGRYPFIILPIMTVVFTTGADYLFEERKLDLPVAVCSILFLSIVLLTKGGEWSGNILPTTEARRHTLWALNVLFIVAALMSTKKKQMVLYYVILPALFIGLIYDNFATVSERETIEISRSEKSIITDCLNELKNGDSNYYRVEKNIDVDSALGDSLYLSYHPATGYCSTINKYVAEFYEKVWPSVGTSTVNRADGYFTSDEMYKDTIMSLLGVKYIIADKDYDQLSNEYYVKTVPDENHRIYQNKSAGSIISTFHHVISTDEFESADPAQRNALLKSCLIVQPEETEQNPLHNTDGINLSVPIEGCSSTREINDGHFIADVSMKSDGYIFISIPYRDGWKLGVNGKEAQFIRADYGFIAVKEPVGEYHLEMVFDNKMYPVGLAISLAGFTLWVFLYLRNKRTKNRQI